MNSTEIKVNELLKEAVDKLIEKYQKKVAKEKEKIKQAYITYKGDKYYTKNDILEAYGCDCFSESTCDRLLERLDRALCGTLDDSMSENELIIIELNKYKSNLLNDIIADRNEKERKAQTEKRMKELMAEGHSFREAETIIGNEELMRYE